MPLRSLTEMKGLFPQLLEMLLADSPKKPALWRTVLAEEYYLAKDCDLFCASLHSITSQFRGIKTRPPHHNSGQLCRAIPHSEVPRSAEASTDTES